MNKQVARIRIQRSKIIRHQVKKILTGQGTGGHFFLFLLGFFSLKESEKTELILAPTWLVRSSGVCNAPRFNFGRTGTQFLSRITGGSRVGMTVMVDQTRSGFIPCAAYCKSANTVFPQTIQCNVHDKRNLGRRVGWTIWEDMYLFNRRVKNLFLNLLQ